jgi:hypothetical protein
VPSIAIVALVLFFGVPAGAQTTRSARSATPEAAMRAFVTAMHAQRWDAAALYIDSLTFSRWLRDQIAAIQRSARHDASEGLLEQFAAVPSTDSLRRLPTRMAIARWIRAGDPRWVTERTIAGMKQEGCAFDPTSIAELMAGIQPDSQRVVGSVERDTFAYVVTQQILRDPGEYGRASDDAALSPRVSRMRRSSSGWVIVDWEQWSAGRGQFIFSGPCVKKDVETAEATVRAFLDALTSERWRDAAALLDLGGFESSLRATIALAKRSRDRPEQSVSVEEMLRHDPNMPRAVAEYHVKQAQEASTRMGDPLLLEYADVPDVDSLARLSTIDAAARRLLGMEPRRRYRRIRAMTNCPPDSAAEESLVALFPPRSVLGSVSASDVAYVLVGDSATATDATKLIARRSPPTVIRVIRWGTRWRIRDWDTIYGTTGFAVACEPAR